MRFVIVGMGFVGTAVHTVLSAKHLVDAIDPKLDFFDERLEHTPLSVKDRVQKATKQNPDGWIICVPTPEANDGRCDDSLVREYVFEIQNLRPYAHILIKSTTAIDTLGSFTGNVTFSPEFLRGSVGSDPTKEFVNSKFMIFGGDDGRWWHDVFHDIMHYPEVRFLDIESAGFLKYAENSFLALKVMFFNELYTLYQKSIDLNYNGMVEALSLDKRIGFSHTAVPGPDGEFGFGGHCLPKDSSEFVEFAKLNNTRLELLELARELNQKYRYGREETQS